MKRRQVLVGAALLASCHPLIGWTGEGSMNNVDALTATRDIMILKARYFRFVDTRDWEAFQQLFTDDATMYFPEGQDKPASLAESLAFIKVVLQGTVSVHMGHSPEITVDSSDAARGIWGMEDKIYWSTDAAAKSGIEYLNGFGHYHEEYARQGGRWLIRRLKLTRLRVDKRAAPRAIA